ncbi:MAG: DUF1015 domain-containing protein [Candidatus Omnitrophica bacterium]|nr:DUF1015 domain-containing protein [Candidatus Omnitrophota bacterium]
MEIRPFQVIHYPFESALLSQVVCPPYDRVTDELIAELRARHPQNFVRAVIGTSLADHKYHDKAASTLRGWLAEGVLKEEEREKVLVYRQRYTCPLTGQNRRRSGFFALLRLPERDKEEVLPHERTFSEHKADRLLLYRAVRGTPEPIFVLYSDPSGKVLQELEQTPTQVEFTDLHEHRNELALLDSPEAVRVLKEVVESQKLLIADGHHRFETGQNYRDECRAANPGDPTPQASDYILVYFTAIEDPGLVILPTHRLVKGVTQSDIESFLSRAKDFFEVEEFPGMVTPDTLTEGAMALAGAKEGREALAFVTRHSIRLLHLRDREKLKSLLPPEVAEPLRDLPVVWLHQVLLGKLLGIRQEEGAPDRIAYVRTGEEVAGGLSEGGYDVAFLLRGTLPEEVKRVAESGHRMPQKSTDFFPKVLSGVAAYLHP